MTVRRNQLAIDWSRQGTYANTQEDVSSAVQPDEIEISVGRDMSGDVSLKSTAGTMAFKLNNRTKVFSPENTASPIAGKVLPGTPVRYQMQHPVTNTIYPLLTGILDSYTVDSNDVARTFSGVALDAWGRPGAEKLSTPLYQGLRTGDAIHLVLDAIGWTGPRDIDPGATVIRWWWEEGTDAATAIDKLVNSEGPPAIAYVDGGTFVFRDRHHRILKTRSLTSQGLYTHIEPAGSGPGGDFKIEKQSITYDHGVRNIVNSATFAVDIRARQPQANVWTSDDAIPILAGETVVLNCQASDPFLYAQTPVLNIDYTTTGVVAMSLDRTNGQSVNLTITCSSDAVISNLAIRAIPVSVVRTLKASARDQSSIGTFGTQEWTEDVPWANQYDAQAIADRIVAVYATYRPTITFTVFALNSTYLTELLESKISDRVTIRIDPLGVNGDFMIERKTHKIKQLGLQYRVEFTCVAVEPTQPANVFTFNVAGKGFNDGLWGLDGLDNPSKIFIFDKAGQGFDQGQWAH